MSLQQKLFSVIAAVFLLVLVIELVRRRKMREEYSFLWILTGVTVFVLAIWYDLLVAVTHLIGAIVPTTTLFIFGMMFLMVICIYFSVKISALTDKLETVAQALALLGQKVDALSRKEE